MTCEYLFFSLLEIFEIKKRNTEKDTYSFFHFLIKI